MFWWIRGLHVLGEWMLVWISSLRITAAIHHQVDPSSIFQSIVIPPWIKNNLKPNYQPIHLPSKAPGFLFPVHFLFIFLTCLNVPNSSAKSLWHVETGTRRPFRSIKQRKGPASLAPMRLRVATKKWERPKGLFYSWGSGILVDTWHVIHISGTCSDTSSNCSNAIWRALDHI